MICMLNVTPCSIRAVFSSTAYLNVCHDNLKIIQVEMYFQLTIIQRHHIGEWAVIRHAQICTQTFYISIKCTARCTAWPEGGSKVTHLCSGCWRWVSCTHSWFYAGTRPAAVPSLSSPPSCTAAAGPSSVAYWGSPQARVCGLPQKSAAEGPIQFPALATLSPKKRQTLTLHLSWCAVVFSAYSFH